MSLPDYIAELDRLSTVAGSYQKNYPSIPEIIRRMPSQWTVRAGNQTYRVPCGYLKAGLLELASKKSDASCRLVQQRIASLKADARALQQPVPDASACRKALNRILAQREFRNAHGPSLWDQWNQRLQAIFLRLLERIFGSSAFPAVSKILVWALVAVAIAVLTFWTYRTLQRNARLEAIALPGSAHVSARPWTAWMAEAHAAAAKECWRDAVRLSYWAGISFLESLGLWRPDRARTPREYLRLLPSSSERRSALSALTRKFEAIWYGQADAGPESFSESLKYLESLGCHSN